MTGSIYKVKSGVTELQGRIQKDGKTARDKSPGGNISVGRQRKYSPIVLFPDF